MQAQGGNGLWSVEAIGKETRTKQQGGAEAAKVHSIICSVRELHHIASVADRES